MSLNTGGFQPPSRGPSPFTGAEAPFVPGASADSSAGHSAGHSAGRFAGREMSQGLGHMVPRETAPEAEPEAEPWTVSAQRALGNILESVRLKEESIRMEAQARAEAAAELDAELRAEAVSRANRHTAEDEHTPSNSPAAHLPTAHGFDIRPHLYPITRGYAQTPRASYAQAPPPASYYKYAQGPRGSSGLLNNGSDGNTSSPAAAVMTSATQNADVAAAAKAAKRAATHYDGMRMQALADAKELEAFAGSHSRSAQEGLPAAPTEPRFNPLPRRSTGFGMDRGPMPETSSRSGAQPSGPSQDGVLSPVIQLPIGPNRRVDHFYQEYHGLMHYPKPEGRSSSVHSAPNRVETSPRRDEEDSLARTPKRAAEETFSPRASLVQPNTGAKRRRAESLDPSITNSGLPNLESEPNVPDSDVQIPDSDVQIPDLDVSIPDSQPSLSDWTPNSQGYPNSDGYTSSGSQHSAAASSSSQHSAAASLISDFMSSASAKLKELFHTEPRQLSEKALSADFFPFVDELSQARLRNNGVIKITNIPFSTSRSEVLAFVGRCSGILDDKLEPVHIIMDLSTGKTEDAYVEFVTHHEARKAVERFNQNKLAGRANRLGDRPVDVEVSTQACLMGDLFPKARGVTWHGPNPRINSFSPDSPWDNFKSFVSVEEMTMLTKLIEGPQRSAYPKECPQRPYESLISMLIKFPWSSSNNITVHQRHAIFVATFRLIESLKAVVLREERIPTTNQTPLNKPLCQRLVRWALACKGFCPFMKASLAKMAGMTREDAYIWYGIPSSACEWLHIYGLAPKPDIPADVIEFYISLVREETKAQVMASDPAMRDRTLRKAKKAAKHQMY